LFFTYLASSIFVPWVGRGIALFGRRRFVLTIIAVWIVGALLMLAAPVTVILAGLTLCAICGMMSQTVATGYVTMTAKEGRSSAVGLYASLYYVGGSAGAFFGGIAWTLAGWAGCVATIAGMLVVIAAIVARAWD
jgi:MFS transporter, YNFM family, putative membrane transport protein